uniref:Uncharacterized protein n=1 Tax=Aegilops tauschii subsp. strangulata TaxID=200361 RepID=A0A453DME9_AEGTS
AEAGVPRAAPSGRRQGPADHLRPRSHRHVRPHGARLPRPGAVQRGAQGGPPPGHRALPSPARALRRRRPRPALPAPQQRGRACHRGRCPGRLGRRARNRRHDHGRRRLLPYSARGTESVGAALLQVKLSRYRCGGLLLGVICHHHIADGMAASTFYAAWATAVREGKGFSVPSPFLDRAATAVPRSTPKPVFDHRSIEFRGSSISQSHALVPMDKIKNIAVHFPVEFIAELKSRVDAPCSTFQCLLAHVWKKITSARGLNPQEFTQVRVGVNCRGRASPPVPMDFFGNMVLWAFPRLQVRDVLGLSYGCVVGAIRDAVARIDDEYIQSYVDFGGVADANGEQLAATSSFGAMLCPDIEAESWLGFRFHQLDFGTGQPSAFLPPGLPVEGLMVFVPSRSAKGSVDLFMAIAEDHVTAFNKICYSLDLLPSRM